MSHPLQPLLFAALVLFAAATQANTEKSEGGEKEASAVSEYVDVKPALITNYGGPGPIHFIKAEVSLRVGKSQEDALTVTHHMPHIRHELIMLFSRQTEENITSMEGKEQLRREALTAVQDVLKKEEGKPIVQDLLFNNFIIQR